MTTTCQETRICSLCGLPRPLSDYERRKDVASGRRAQCNVCINERRRVCLRRRRDQLTRVALRRAADAKAEGVVLAIANELNRRFHGIEGVGEELERFYLAEHRRSAFAATRAMRGMARILFVANKIRERAKPPLRAS